MDSPSCGRSAGSTLPRDRRPAFLGDAPPWLAALDHRAWLGFPLPLLVVGAPEPEVKEPARGDPANGSKPPAARPHAGEPLTSPPRGVLDCDAFHPLITHSSIVALPHPKRPNPSPLPPPYEPHPLPPPLPPRDLPRRCLPRWWPARPGICIAGACIVRGSSPWESPADDASATPPRVASTCKSKSAPEVVASSEATPPSSPGVDSVPAARAFASSSATGSPPRSSAMSTRAASSVSPITPPTQGRAPRSV